MKNPPKEYYLLPSTREPVPEQPRRIDVLPYGLPGVPRFKFSHEIRPPEKRYDYYEAHPEHRPRPLTARQIRRRAIREG
jgi:hypothetical protein